MWRSLPESPLHLPRSAERSVVSAGRSPFSAGCLPARWVEYCLSAWLRGCGRAPCSVGPAEEVGRPVVQDCPLREAKGGEEQLPKRCEQIRATEGASWQQAG